MGGLITLGLLGVLIMMGLSGTASAKSADPYQQGLSSENPGEVLVLADQLYHAGRTQEAEELRKHALTLIGGDTSWEAYFAVMPISLQIQVIDALNTREPGVIRAVASQVSASGFVDISARMLQVADILEAANRAPPVQTQGWPSQGRWYH